MTNDYVPDINVGKIESDDLISREAAIDVVRKWFDKIQLNGDICLDGIISLLSVTPTRPTARWEELVGEFKKCSKCRMAVKCYHNYKYCPECGAKMQEVEE